MDRTIQKSHIHNNASGLYYDHLRRRRSCAPRNQYREPTSAVPGLTKLPYGLEGAQSNPSLLYGQEREVAYYAIF